MSAVLHNAGDATIADSRRRARKPGAWWAARDGDSSSHVTDAIAAGTVHVYAPGQLEHDDRPAVARAVHDARKLDAEDRAAAAALEAAETAAGVDEDLDDASHVDEPTG